jgi:hypothetical protein
MTETETADLYQPTSRRWRSAHLLPAPRRIGSRVCEPNAVHRDHLILY